MSGSTQTLPEVPWDSRLLLLTARMRLEPVTLAHEEELWEIYRDARLHAYPSAARSSGTKGALREVG
jgi:hypothetical protein